RGEFRTKDINFGLTVRNSTPTGIKEILTKAHPNLFIEIKSEIKSDRGGFILVSINNLKEIKEYVGQLETKTIDNLDSKYISTYLSSDNNQFIKLINDKNSIIRRILTTLASNHDANGLAGLYRLIEHSILPVKLRSQQSHDIQNILHQEMRKIF